MSRSIQQIQKNLITIQGHKFLIDQDVAQWNGVATKGINEALSNNPHKFPEGYVLELNTNEKKELVENFDQFEQLKFSKTNPKAYYNTRERIANYSKIKRMRSLSWFINSNS